MQEMFLNELRNLEKSKNYLLATVFGCFYSTLKYEYN